MSNFPTRARAQPILPPRQRLIYAGSLCTSIRRHKM
jgi:hypothetical protein